MAGGVVVLLRFLCLAKQTAHQIILVIAIVVAVVILVLIPSVLLLMLLATLLLVLLFLELLGCFFLLPLPLDLLFVAVLPGLPHPHLGVMLDARFFLSISLLLLLLSLSELFVATFAVPLHLGSQFLHGFLLLL